MLTGEKRTLLETTYSPALRVDREAGIIRNVKILGRDSRNGRTYSDTALNEAARLYEGLGVNIDHPDRGVPDADRRLADGFGHLQNVRKNGDAVYGDLVYLKSHALAAQICEAADRMPRQLGLSHNAEGYVVHREGRWMVEHLERVRSVDLVRTPATNRGLFESTGSDDATDVFGGANRATSAASDSARIRETILEFLADESADDAARVRRMREWLSRELPDTSSLQETGPQITGPQAAGTMAGLTTSVAQLQETVTRLERREQVRALLEEYGYASEPRVTSTLMEMQSEAEMRTWLDQGTGLTIPQRQQRPMSRPPVVEGTNESGVRIDLKDNNAVAAYLRA